MTTKPKPRDREQRAIEVLTPVLRALSKRRWSSYYGLYEGGPAVVVLDYLRDRFGEDE